MGTARAEPEPRVDIHVVGIYGTEHYRGQPIVLELTVFHPDAASARYSGEPLTPISIAVPTGGWTQLMKLVIRNAQGELQTWPFQVLTSVGSSLTLDATNSGRLTLVLPPTDTASLTPGQYSLRLWLDTRTGSTDAAWKGWAAKGVDIELKDEPPVLTAAQHCEKGYVLSHFHQAKGQMTQAVSALDAALVQAPEETRCLSSRAELARSMGQPYTAIDLYQRAIQKLSSVYDDEAGQGSSAIVSACQSVMSTLPATERRPWITCGYASCTGETDAELCAQEGAECGNVTRTDRCGRVRIIDACGSCTQPETCGGGGTANTCGQPPCTPESNTAFCSRLGKNCGAVTAPDNCGTTRSVVSCGVCAPGVLCTGNVCEATACVPTQSCGGQCGCVDDGCGNGLYCGSCTSTCAPGQYACCDGSCAATKNGCLGLECNPPPSPPTYCW
ncbi:hypothetical protein [Archangium violaceum]|uniref:hypothetical protein n=1 Tax=Archangium violaceum TaxID=83451 RepID=UPI0036D9855D